MWRLLPQASQAKLLKIRLTGNSQNGPKHNGNTSNAQQDMVSLFLLKLYSFHILIFLAAIYLKLYIPIQTLTFTYVIIRCDVCVAGGFVTVFSGEISLSAHKTTATQARCNAVTLIHSITAPKELGIPALRMITRYERQVRQNVLPVTYNLKTY